MDLKNWYTLSTRKQKKSLGISTVYTGYKYKHMRTSGFLKTRKIFLKDSFLLYHYMR